jgi:hypothetical protein
MDKKINIVCERRLKKYFEISEKAFKIAEKSIVKGREQDAAKILEMARCYLSDARHFEKKGNYVNAFAAINYSHGWLDCGARLGIFDVSDTKLFTIK